MVGPISIWSSFTHLHINAKATVGCMQLCELIVCVVPSAIGYWLYRPTREGWGWPQEGLCTCRLTTSTTIDQVREMAPVIIFGINFEMNHASIWRGPDDRESHPSTRYTNKLFQLFVNFQFLNATRDKFHFMRWLRSVDIFRPNIFQRFGLFPLLQHRLFVR